MHLLILGGTRFLGRHLVAAALVRGHVLTLVHRGVTNPGLFPEAEHRLGDRTGDLSFLAGAWDAAIDLSGYVPRVVHGVSFSSPLEASPDCWEFGLCRRLYWPARTTSPAAKDAVLMTADRRIVFRVSLFKAHRSSRRVLSI